jgi:DNA-damage-inducible protein J
VLKKYNYDIIFIEVMKMRTEIVKASINKELKTEVENTLRILGLSSSDVIRMLYSQIKLTKSIPFEISIPEQIHVHTKKTLEVFDKIDRGEELHQVDNIEQLKKELDDNC